MSIHETVADRHQSRRFDRFLNNWRLALLQLEVDYFPRLSFPSSEFLLDFLLEILFRQVTGFVQPGCTIEVLPFPPRQFSQRSRGYCLEMICSDFLAGANLDKGDPQTLLFSMARSSNFFEENSNKHSS